MFFKEDNGISMVEWLKNSFFFLLLILVALTSALFSFFVVLSLSLFLLLVAMISWIMVVVKKGWHQIKWYK